MSRLVLPLLHQRFDQSLHSPHLMELTTGLLSKPFFWLVCLPEYNVQRHLERQIQPP
jgi:hypothetical protein